MKNNSCKFYDIAIVNGMGNEIDISVILDRSWSNYIVNCNDVIPYIFM